MSRTNGDYTTVYVGGLLEVDSDASAVTGSRTFYSFAGSPAVVRENEADETTFVNQNHLGSGVAAFNDDTNTLALTRYRPWGAERSLEGAQPSDHRFTGQIADNTTAPSAGLDLLFYNARYYDPSLASFVAPDVFIPGVANPATLNRYSYVLNDPVRMADPSGHCGVDVVEVWDRPAGGCKFYAGQRILEHTVSLAKDLQSRAPGGWASRFGWFVDKTLQRGDLEGWWIDTFSEGGPGDPKGLHYQMNGENLWVLIPGADRAAFRVDLFGNIIYGYVAESKLTSFEANKGARYGGGIDDHSDYVAVDIGRQLWAEHGTDLTVADLVRALDAATDDFFLASDADWHTETQTGSDGVIPIGPGGGLNPQHPYFDRSYQWNLLGGGQSPSVR